MRARVTVGEQIANRGWPARMLLPLVASLASSCATAHFNAPPPPPEMVPYRIGADDVVEVDVWKDPSLSTTVPVRPDGYITVPLVGDVLAVGHTTDELEQLIGARLQSVLRAPLVSVLVRQANSNRFFVLGEVVHPGAFTFHSPITLLQAIAMSGGMTPFADGNRLILIRLVNAKDARRYELSYRAALRGGAPTFLATGDTVFVP